MQNRLTHIAGTFLIPATGSFLNGAGLAPGEDRNVVIPKTFRDGKNRVPYVSAQAWKRWLRNTVVEEQGWPISEIVAIDVSKKGTTNKISGKLDPVLYPEDDIFGYMRAEKGQGKTKEQQEEDSEENDDESAMDTGSRGRERVKSVMRASPFMASLLVSIRRTGWEGRDEGFVHLKEGTPQPYTTEFYNTHLQGVFCLNYSRLGVFSNVGDRIELDERKVQDYLAQQKIREIDKVVKEEDGKEVTIGKIYELTNAESERKERASAVIRALAVLRGGAKQAAFGTAVEPQALILAGLSSGNPVFHHLFKDDGNGPEIKVNTLTEIISDYRTRFKTPVFLGIRSGYLLNEDEVRGLKGQHDGIEIEVTSPLQAAEGMAKCILDLK
jgi:CRISPR-associated protein Cst2